MPGFNVTWDDGAVDLIRAAFERRIYACGAIIQRRAKVLLSVAGTGQRVKAGLSKHGKRMRARKRAGKRARRLNKGVKAFNRLARKHGKGLGLKPTKKRFRATKAGGLTTRRRPKRRKGP